MIDPETYDLIVKVRDMPEALQEYIYGAVKLAEDVRHLLPGKFVVPPSGEDWAEFHAYLKKLAGTLPRKPK